MTSLQGLENLRQLWMLGDRPAAARPPTCLPSARARSIPAFTLSVSCRFSNWAQAMVMWYIASPTGVVVSIRGSCKKRMPHPHDLRVCRLFETGELAIDAAVTVHRPNVAS